MAPDPYNPVTGNQGFTVFVRGNAALNATSSGGPVALGGNLTFGPGTFDLATQTAGTFTAPGDSRPTGLLVEGNINWAGSASSGAVNVLYSSYVKVGDLTGSAVAQSGSAATHVVPTGTLSSSPQIADVVNQPTSSVNQSGLVNFASAFAAFAGNSSDLASCAGTVVLTSANGTPLTLPLVPGTNAYVTLAAGTQNVLDISAANLANISILQFRNAPTATMPLIINVDTSGAGNNFSWSPPNFNGLQSAAAGYMLWNFPTATQVTFDGSSTVPGTVYAPGATFNDYESNGLNGGVIAAAYAQGGPGGSPNGGQVLSAPFAATIGSCATPQLTISATASPATAVPGGVVHETVTVTNSGSVAYTGATFTDPLSDVLGDASYHNDAAATAGSVAFASPNLTWTGNLAAGATATVTFSVTVNNPDTGDKVLASTVTSAATGSNCPVGGTDPRCASTITVLVPGLTIAVSAGPATTTPGATVHYTVMVTNSGQTAYTGATFTDPLSGVLDDAAYHGDAAATTGSVAFSSPNLTWTGNLAVGASAIVTFLVTVHRPDTGDEVLASTVTSSTPGSNCAAGSGSASCTAIVDVDVSALTIDSTASVSTTTPGSTVDYTITITNTGQTTYTGATVTDPLDGVLYDAADTGPTSYTGATVTNPLGGVLSDETFNHDAAATSGSVSYASPVLTWTGDPAPGATVTITFSVTLSNPDTGDIRLVNTAVSDAAGSNCPAGSTDPRCSAIVDVLDPTLTITKTASVSTATPGTAVRYTITVADTDQTAYSGATVTDSLAGVLGDATYAGGAAASSGTVSYAAPVLSWTGDLAAGDTATITYSVTVNNPDTGGRVLTNTAVSSAPGSTCPPGTTSPGCTVSVSVIAGALSITAPGSAFLGSAAPGGSVSGSLGIVQVTDSQGFGADWTVTVSATDFTTGTATSAETIPVSDASYDISALSRSSGPATFTTVPATNLAASAQAVVTATGVGGNNSAAWDPLINVSVPGGAVGGPYTATITESVS